MKKGKLLATLLCSASMVMGSLVPTVPAMADAMKVVTLGADLSDEQKNTMLKYFQVSTKSNTSLHAICGFSCTTMLFLFVFSVFSYL